MQKNEREREIVNLLKKKDGFVSTRELCERLFSSESSIRRSLVSLEGEEDRLSRSFLVNHLASSFVEAVIWWIDGGMTESAESIYHRLESVTGQA